MYFRTLSLISAGRRFGGCGDSIGCRDDSISLKCDQSDIKWDSDKTGLTGTCIPRSGYFSTVVFGSGKSRTSNTIYFSIFNLCFCFVLLLFIFVIFFRMIPTFTLFLKELSKIVADNSMFIIIIITIIVVVIIIIISGRIRLGVCFRSRSALAVICWVINHCLEVSCEVVQITSAEHEWFLFLQLTDKQCYITQQIDLFRS